MSDTVVYLILGARGSSRRSVVSDLIEFGHDESDRCLVAVSEGEPDREPLEVRKRAVSNIAYAWDGERLDCEVDGDFSTVFLIADGASSPADSVEAFHGWLAARGFELGRVLTVLNCGLLHRNAALNVWFDCCIHFSDFVLLSERQDVPNKWVADLMEKYEKLRFPCTFVYVKKGRVANPALVLYPEPRRISMIFDVDDESVDLSEYLVIDDDGKEVEADDEDEEEESIAGDLTQDTYLRRLPNGRREKPVPLIGKFLLSE